MFVAASTEDAAGLKAIADSAVGSVLSPGALGPHDQVLAPTVCYHCFEALGGATLGGDSLYTAMGSCHRFEILAGVSLDRLQTYRMREVIAFGAANQIAGTLDALLEFSESLLGRWNVPYRVATAMDPFFIGALESKAYFQTVFELKRELQLRLDFSGRWLAIASFNNHQQSLTRAFGISSSGEKLESGCAGWGLERFAYTLLAHFGTDLARWPREVLLDLAI
jgi:seryl-tRNA synthetase